LTNSDSPTLTNIMIYNDNFFADCVFISETQGIIPSGETESVKIDETEQKDKVILSLTTSSGSKGYNYLNI
jgi:hypothetical protein